MATVTPNLRKVGQHARAIQVATARIDASGNFVLRPDPTSRPLARVIVEAITKNGGWLNLDLLETGSDGKTAITSISRQYVDASDKPLSLAKFQAAPDGGHWIGDGTSGTTVDPKHEITLPPAQRIPSLTKSRSTTPEPAGRASSRTGFAAPPA